MVNVKPFMNRLRETLKKATKLQKTEGLKIYIIKKSPAALNELSVNN